LGERRDLVDQLALTHPPHGEGEARAQRQAVKDGGERKPDQRGGERAAEDDDRRMGVGKHSQVAAHQNERDPDDASGGQAEAGCHIHERTPSEYANGRTPTMPPPVPAPCGEGGRTRRYDPSPRALKGRLPKFHDKEFVTCGMAVQAAMLPYSSLSRPSRA